jgi:hypothetical protein
VIVGNLLYKISYGIMPSRAICGSRFLMHVAQLKAPAHRLGRRPARDSRHIFESVRFTPPAMPFDLGE